MAMAIGCRSSEPIPVSNAEGIIPKIMARVVIMIGLRRICPASRIASFLSPAALTPAFNKVDEQDRVLGYQSEEENHSDQTYHTESDAGDKE